MDKTFGGQSLCQTNRRSKSQVWLFKTNGNHTWATLRSWEGHRTGEIHCSSHEGTWRYFHLYKHYHCHLNFICLHKPLAVKLLSKTLQTEVDQPLHFLSFYNVLTVWRWLTSHHCHISSTTWLPCGKQTLQQQDSRQAVLMNGVPASKNGDLKYGLEEILDTNNTRRIRRAFWERKQNNKTVHEKTHGRTQHVLQTHRTVSPHGIFHASVRVFDLSRIA